MKLLKFEIIIIFIAIVIIIGGISNYKQEILHCSKSKNECFVEKINLFNIKRTKKIVTYSDIQKVSYIKQKIKGNLYAKGYTDYQLIFVTKDNSRKIIFSNVYFEYPKIVKSIRTIKSYMKSSSDILIFEYNN